MKTLCFQYGEKETEYLKSKDKKLAAVIDQIGHIERSCYGDLFEAVVNSIWKKADYIMEFSEKVNSGAFSLNAIYNMSDEDAIAALSSLKGVGVWTAEMILLFCLQRPNIFSFGDLAILRGVRMVYRHKELSKERFERYRKRLSPYCSTASLYFWAVAGGAIPGLTDPAAEKKRR